MENEFFSAKKTLETGICSTILFSPDSRYLVFGSNKDILIYELEYFSLEYSL
jgi:hypothetical protein